MSISHCLILMDKLAKLPLNNTHSAMPFSFFSSSNNFSIAGVLLVALPTIGIFSILLPMDTGRTSLQQCDISVKKDNFYAEKRKSFKFTKAARIHLSHVCTRDDFEEWLSPFESVKLNPIYKKPNATVLNKQNERVATDMHEENAEISTNTIHNGPHVTGILKNNYKSVSGPSLFCKQENCYNSVPKIFNRSNFMDSTKNIAISAKNTENYNICETEECPQSDTNNSQDIDCNSNLLNK